MPCLTDNRVIAAVKASAGNQAQAARALKVNASVIYYRVARINGRRPGAIETGIAGRRTGAKRSSTPAVIPVDEAALWVRLVADRDDKVTRNALWEHFLPLAQMLYGRLLSRVPPYVDRDLLLSAAQLGLYQAIEGFDPARGYRFATYAPRRIIGAMQDALRKEVDYVGRQGRAMINRREQIEDRLAQELGRRPTTEEVEQLLAGDLPERMRLSDTTKLPTISIDRPRYGNDDDDAIVLKDVLVAERDQSHEERFDSFLALTRGLRAQQRSVVYLYEIVGLTMKQSGEILSISESRVSQVHADAMADMRRRQEEAQAADAS